MARPCAAVAAGVSSGMASYLWPEFPRPELFTDSPARSGGCSMAPPGSRCPTSGRTRPRPCASRWCRCRMELGLGPWPWPLLLNQRWRGALYASPCWPLGPATTVMAGRALRIFKRPQLPDQRVIAAPPPQHAALPRLPLPGLAAVVFPMSGRRRPFRGLLLLAGAADDSPPISTTGAWRWRGGKPPVQPCLRHTLPRSGPTAAGAAVSAWPRPGRLRF